MIARAQLYSMRHSARKVQVLLDLIRGKSVEEAYERLAFAPRRPAGDVLKLLRSAVANARQRGEHLQDALYVSRVYADQGRSMKKFEPKAMLRHGQKKRRTCHVTIELSARGAPAAAATAAPGGA